MGHPRSRHIRSARFPLVHARSSRCSVIPAPTNPWEFSKELCVTREVLLIEDDAGLRESTATVINQLDQFRCVAHCDWTTWHSRKPGTKRIQVAIASIRKLDRPTHARLRDLRRCIPASEVIVLCERATLSCLRGLLALGIGSVVLKGSTAYDLSLALLATGHGGAYFSPGLGRLLGQAVGRRMASAGRDHDLTVREREVWEALAHDKSNKEIANRLKISPQTVETHVRNLYRKLGCKNRKQARALHWDLDGPNHSGPGGGGGHRRPGCR